MPFLSLASYKALLDAGREGSVDDILRIELESQGHTGTVDDMFRVWIGHDGTVDDAEASWDGTFSVTAVEHGSAVVTITPTDTSTVAGIGVQWTASISGGPSNQDLDAHCITNANDTGDSATASNLTTDDVFDNNVNETVGRFGGHVYLTAGTFAPTATFYWIESGTLYYKTGTSSSISVADPDTYYSTNDTAIVALDGDFTGAPAGTQYSTVAALNTALATYNPGGTGLLWRDKVRIRFKKGATTDFGATGLSAIRGPGASGDLLIDGWGTGADPILTRTGDPATPPAITASANILEYWGSTGRVGVVNIQFDGGYDPVNHSIAGTHYKAIGLNAYEHTIVCMTNCTCYGASAMVYGYCTDNARKGRWVIQNNHITDWIDYGTLLSAGDVVLKGNHMKQDENCAFGTVGKGETADRDEIYADHGPGRFSKSSAITDNFQVLLAKNDVRSVGGWSGLVGTTAHQPCLRVAVYGTDHVGIKYITNNRMQGGYPPLTLEDPTGTGTHVNTMTLVDGNYILGDEQNVNSITVSSHGAIIRNNVMVKPSITQDPNNNKFTRFVLIDFSGGTTEPSPDTIYSYCNTMVQLQTTVQAGSSYTIAESTDDGTTHTLVEEDNIVLAEYASNWGTFTDYSPLDSSNYYKPQSGSAAIGAAGGTQDPPIADFNNDLRTPDNTAIGAWKG